MTIILFIIVLAVLIFVHELGHFLSARACGIRVDEFSIGFGPKLWSIKKGGTEYLIKLIPFGGYVKIFGENPDEDSINGPEKEKSFVNKPKWQQIIVLASGVIFNFIFGWLLISFAFSSGIPASIESYSMYADRMQDKRIVVTYIEPNSPAEKVGLKVGDSISGYNSLESLQNAINKSKDNGIDISFKRGEEEFQDKIVAKEGIVAGKYAIGIGMDYVATLKLPFYLALKEGFKFTIYIIKSVAISFYGLIAGIFSGTSHWSEVAGPVGIAGLVRDAANLGFMYLLSFTALISINLGVLNFIPFPALDGGRILFVMIEAIIRRPIKPSVANTVNAIGFGLLLLLMVVVTYKDIMKILIK